MGTQNKNLIGSTKNKINKSATSTEPEIYVIVIRNDSLKKVVLKITCEGYNDDDILMFSNYEIITVYPDLDRCGNTLYLPLPFYNNLHIRFFNFTFSIINVDTGEERIISDMDELFLDVETRNGEILDSFKIICNKDSVQSDFTDENIKAPKSVYTVVME